MIRRCAAVLALVVLGGCAAQAPTRSVTVSFGLKVGDRPVGCGQAIAGLGLKKTTAQLSDARLYLQDIALIDAGGKRVPLVLPDNAWQLGGVALIDFENATGACRGTPALNTQVTGSVPAGDYVGLAFTIGVPPALNHTSHVTTPAPLDSVAMAWSWQAGRKFIKIELDPEGGVSRPGGARPSSSWYLHLGSTGCQGDPAKGESVTCTNPNRIPVVFPAFNPASQQVVLDLLPLFAATDITKDGGGAPGCMSGPEDPDCPGVFGQLGLNLYGERGGLPVGDGTQPRFLRVEAKP